MNSTQRSTKKIARLTLALLAAGAIGGTGLAACSGTAYAQALLAPTQSSAPIGTVATPNFAQINKLYGPAVVNITVKGVEKVSDSQDDPFQQFFGQFPGFPGMPHGSHNVPMEGVGSGFIVSSNGIILTNAHVVKDAKSVVVKLTDRREYRAKVLGSDPQTDVAVIKIDATNLPTVKIGHVSSLQVGDWVLAIGSPYGLESTATAGIVSALGRSLPDDTSVPFIQTDVPVNPGNSGGPLFNSQGEVVGINSQIYTKTGGYQGLSFSIPIDVAEKIKDQILAHGKVQHARLGVTAQEVNQELADSFNLPSPSGALIASVMKDSAAAHAGLKPGDIIRKIDGRDIISSGDLASAINMDAPGQRITMDVWRNGKPMTLTATLGKLDDSGVTADVSSVSAGHGKLGVALRPLTPQEASAIGTQGLLVEQVSGAAERAGIQPEDVILAINGVPATSVDQVRKEVANAKGTIALLIQRGDNKIFVPVRLK
ncbi:MAG TPA: Do family serine endopeptidase [Bordetella sp.]|uniref:Do family serine endopeptidase n=1 Tax=Bordetella sp. TaxID=28081 RepID=UPI002ED1A625